MHLLVEEPLILLFAVLALGSFVGSLKFGGFSFGSAAVLFAGLAASAYDPHLLIPRIVGTLGLAIFAYSIGISSGPQFFNSLSHYRAAVGLVAGLLVAAAGVAVLVGKALSLNGPIIAGLYAGALTNTPALAASVEALNSNAPTVGYSVSYIGGVLGMVVAVTVSSLAKTIRAEQAAKADAPPPKLVNKTVRVTESDLPMLGTIAEEGHVVFSRVSRDGAVRVATDGFRPQPGDLVSVIGPRPAVDRIVQRFGHTSSRYLTEDRRDLDFRRMAVSNHEVAGRTVAELKLLRKFGATATRVRRGDVDLLAEDDLQLQIGDRVRIVAPRERMGEIAAFLGDSERGSGELDPTAFALGLLIGLLLGSLQLPLPSGGSFALGMAGGPLIAGLLLGRINRSGPLLWAMPFQASNVLNHMGILLFLAYAGTNAGDDLVAALGTDEGVRILGAGLVVTAFAAFGLTFLGPVLAGLAGPRLTGIIAGFQTQPAVLSFANERCGGDPRVNLGYALAYPVAMIVKVIVAPLLGRF